MIEQFIKNRDVDGIKEYMAANGLVAKDGKIVPKDDETKKELKKMSEFWDQRQQARED